MDLQKMKDTLAGNLTRHRYAHTLGVADTAKRLAVRFGVDEEKAYLAGILHDCAKWMDVPQMMSVMREMNVTPDEAEKETPAVLHAPAGKACAMRDFGITDSDVLEAIRTHTVGGAGMSALQKLIYLSDFIEPGREEFPGLKEVRAIAETDLNAAVLACANLTMNYVNETGRKMHPATAAMMKELEETGK